MVVTLCVFVRPAKAGRTEPLSIPAAHPPASTMAKREGSGGGGSPRPRAKAGVAKGEPEQVAINLPAGLHRAMLAAIEKYDLWPYPPRQNLIVEAVKRYLEYLETSPFPVGHLEGAPRRGEHEERADEPE